MLDQPLHDLGVVVATYGSGRCVDVLMPNGDQLSNVSVMSEHASSSSGSHDLPDIGNPPGDARWLLTASPERYVRAVVCFIRGVPICLGFVFPQLNQVTFNQINRKIDRHASDFYSTIDQYANAEWSHPSGSYFRIGTNPAHEDLTNQNYQQNWNISANTASAPHVHLQVANAGRAVATIDIDPSGNILVQHNGDMTVNVGGNLEASVAGTTSVTSGGAADVKAPSVTVDSPQSTFTGAVTVEGPFTFQSGMTGKAGANGGSTMTITGDAHFTGIVEADTDVLAAGTSGKGHKHGGVERGGDVSDGPQ